jgi:hypothetical protein
VLSSYADGSAQVMVVAGETAVTNAVTKAIRLRPGSPSGTALTAARIDAIVSDIVVNFGGGDQTISDFSTPLRTWWANSATICCRYVLNCGLGTMRAIIDIHAFKAGVSDRAFVEVVIENAEVDSASPSAPAPQAYTGATVKVNGATIATQNDPTPGTYLGNTTYAAGTHEAFRAWYCSTWVGLDPGIEVTHDTASMQAHPIFYRPARASSVNLQATYENDAYEPWSYERQRGANMGAPGDGDGSIGYLPLWDAQYLQSGSKFARRAVIANALAALSYTINYRDATTKLVPTPNQVGSKIRSDNSWPHLDNNYPSWKTSHSPNVGLMAFLCRPSPCFIEIAQKASIWNTTWFTGDHTFDFWFQTRGRAWGLRAQAHAMFLTPTTVHADVTAWRTQNATAFAASIAKLDVYRTTTTPPNPLGVIYDYDPNDCYDQSSNALGGFQQALWQSYFLTGTLHMIASAKVLTGADQVALDAFVDWAMQSQVRYINEQAHGGWRFIRHMTTIGTNDWWNNNADHTGPDPGQLADWNTMINYWMNAGTPPAESGPWLMHPDGLPRSWQDAGVKTDSVAWTQENYVVNFWSSLALAVERDVPGAAAAWSRIVAGLGSNLGSWLDGFAAMPIGGHYPRNK